MLDSKPKNSNTETALRARGEMSSLSFAHLTPRPKPRRTKLSASNRGAVLFLSIIVLSVLFAIALGVSTTLVGQVRQLSGMESSVHAFFAADTGIEQGLYEEQAVSGVLISGGTYQVQFLPPGPECSSQNYCLKSVGAFRDSRRAIEAGR